MQVTSMSKYIDEDYDLSARGALQAMMSKKYLCEGAMVLKGFLIT